MASCRHVLLLVAAAAVRGLSAVPNVQLANGVEMPIVSFGTWQYNDSVAESACTGALAAGFNHFDTALNYGNQAGVGKFFKNALSTHHREDLFLTTKVPGCGTYKTVKSGNCGPGTVDAVARDLELLGVDYVDLILVHSPPLGGCDAVTCKEIQSQWKAVEDAYNQNKTRAVGVSNYCEACFACLMKTATVAPMVNQMNYHVGMHKADASLKAYLAAHNITLQAWSPLGDGSKELITGDLTTGIGKQHNKTGAQVALRWVVQQNVPLSTKTTNPKYIAEDIDLFSWELSDNEMQQLNTATKPAGAGPNVACLMSD